MPSNIETLLLAEADCAPDDQLIEMDSEFNPDFRATTCVIVLSANDVVQPRRRAIPTSPLLACHFRHVLEVDHGPLGCSWSAQPWFGYCRHSATTCLSCPDLNGVRPTASRCCRA